MTGISVDIVHGKPVRISPLVRRITAANSSPMTGPGTNTYLVGEAEIAVVDPGPDDPAHIETILEACGDRLKWILVTHTHPDHSPAAMVLAKASGATVLGNKLAEDDGYQDTGFHPCRSFEPDEQLHCGEFSLQAIHTPGHVDNHLCFLLKEERLLLTGDHIMQGSTVVIIPPYGDMKAYIESLQRLQHYSLGAIAPGHGLVIEDPVNEIERLIRHRLGREAKVVERLYHQGGASLDMLTALVYDDVDSRLHQIASYSLLAHLIKLQREGRARCDGEIWSPC